MESRQVFHLVCVLSGLVALPPGLRAQETDRIGEQVERYLKQREQPGDLLAGYRDGFFLGTRDGRFRLTLGGRLQTDARFLESGHPSQNTFLVRRARLHLAGHVQERFGFKVEGDLGEGSARLKDGYLNVAFSDRIALRAGQFKEPFGFEELTSSRYVSLVERSLPIDNLAPSRDIGFMVHGKLAGGLLAYQLGAFNGAGDNLMSDANDDKDLALRLSLRPFQSSGKPVLEGLQLGAAATRGNQEGSLAGEAFDTAVGTGFLSFAPGVVQDGRRTRLGAELAWLVGPASLRGEWMQSR
ncbi:MAG: OprO/OprP family phosphate-selective porin, partial [Planctomycetota bacterium]